MFNPSQPVKPELLNAFLEPIIYEIVERRLNEKLEKIQLKTVPEEPIKIKDAAEMLGYSISHIYTLCKQNKIPYVRSGRRIYFYVSELNEWLKYKR